MFNFKSLLNVTHFEKKKVERTRDKKDELFRHLERVAPRVLLGILNWRTVDLRERAIGQHSVAQS